MTEEGRKAAFTLNKHVLSTTDNTNNSSTSSGERGGGGGISVLPSKYPAVLETKPHLPSFSTSEADASHQDTSIHHQPPQQQPQHEEDAAKEKTVYNKYLSSSSPAAPDVKEQVGQSAGKADKKARINIDK